MKTHLFPLPPQIDSKRKNYLSNCRSRIIDMENTLKIQESSSSNLFNNINSIKTQINKNRNNLKLCINNIIRYKNDNIDKIIVESGNDWFNISSIFMQKESSKESKYKVISYQEILIHNCKWGLIQQDNINSLKIWYKPNFVTITTKNYDKVYGTWIVAIGLVIDALEKHCVDIAIEETNSKNYSKDIERLEKELDKYIDEKDKSDVKFLEQKKLFDKMHNFIFILSQELISIDDVVEMMEIINILEVTMK